MAKGRIGNVTDTDVCFFDKNFYMHILRVGPVGPELVQDVPKLVKINHRSSENASGALPPKTLVQHKNSNI